MLLFVLTTMIAFRQRLLVSVRMAITQDGSGQLKDQSRLGTQANQCFPCDRNEYRPRVQTPTARYVVFLYCR